MPAVVGFDEDALPPSPEEVRYFLFYLFLGCFIVIKTLMQVIRALSVHSPLADDQVVLETSSSLFKECPSLLYPYVRYKNLLLVTRQAAYSLSRIYSVEPGE